MASEYILDMLAQYKDDYFVNDTPNGPNFKKFNNDIADWSFVIVSIARSMDHIIASEKAKGEDAFLPLQNDRDKEWFFEHSLGCFRLPMTYILAGASCEHINNVMFIDVPSTGHTFYLSGVPTIESVRDNKLKIWSAIRSIEAMTIIQHAYKYPQKNREKMRLHAHLKVGGKLPLQMKQPSSLQCNITYDDLEEVYVECTNTIVQHCFSVSIYTDYAKSNTATVSTKCPMCREYDMNPQAYQYVREDDQSIISKFKKYAMT